ncbi:hypothetical protein [Mucilaginibacter polytrichastri]|uniref:Uncharacterized protein n=1 Tax=Mucilaginibacter polytrichastri TaxID=1302689 RepID=A0A1Q6A299_9SPHI|nr:hypothetical protein [Mucilaginibacter polytrichastri]OKS88133.1 hypothetical protein RG47T_3597 [Mucilaginibacter polytrichastri]SFT09359.1 hypothetical protein SAMN04487890_110109 [Mucilaginibacter polytrichastri]
MDRIIIKCAIQGLESELQLDKKAMPGEAGPCFMITTSGSFKGYIARQKNGSYKSLGTSYYTSEDLQIITVQLSKSTQ